MFTAKHIIDWIFNGVIGAAAIGCGFGAFYGTTLAQKWTFGAVGLAFGVACFLFCRSSIASMQVNK